MRRFLFEKARFLAKNIKPIYESPHSVRLKVGNFEVEFFYKKYKLNFWCSCFQGSTLQPCAHMIAGMDYLIHTKSNYFSKISDYDREPMQTKQKEKLTSCPDWLKEAYRKAVGFKCEECGRMEENVGKLEPHRLKRGNKGGEYIPRNVKMLCKYCHRLGDSAYHGNEQ